MPDKEWDADDNGPTIEMLSISIDTLKTKESAHKWKRDNQETIDGLGADKGVVMTKYLNKVKELN